MLETSITRLNFPIRFTLFGARIGLHFLVQGSAIGNPCIQEIPKLRQCLLIGNIGVGNNLPNMTVLALEVEPASLVQMVNLAVRP